MKTRTRILSVALFALPAAFFANVGFAQYGGGVGAYGAYGAYGSPYVYTWASTAAEGYLQGLSNVISAKGYYNLLSSQAAINFTEAWKNDIQNRELWVNAYFAMRKANRAARIDERGPMPSPGDMLKYAQIGKPKVLGPNHLDPASGKIYWPRALRIDQYAADRALLEELFVKRARYGDISMDELMKVVDTTNRMLDRLKDDLHTMTPAEYVSAKQFLVSLAYGVQTAA
jgi:hypothetical protein